VNKVVLVYSANFWQPGAIPQDGIGLVSSRIFEAIVDVYPNHEIIFLDYNDLAGARKLNSIDHFFGISSNFHKFCKVLKPKKATLIAVNEHPLLRRTIKRRSKSNGFSRKYLDGLDGIFSNLKENRYADNVIAFGSWNTFASYKIAGFDPKQVLPIGWKYWDNFYPSVNEDIGNDILVFMGSISNRKGVGVLEKIVQHLVESHPEFRLKLVGFTSNKAWKSHLRNLESRYSQNFHWVQERIEYGSDGWLDLRRKVSFAIFPSFEEGLAGCAMDVINLGVPLIHSSKTGIEIAHRLLLDFDFENDNWRAALSNLICGGQELWTEIFNAQSSAAFFQNPSNTSIHDAVQRSKTNDMWPALDFSEDFSFVQDFSFEIANFGSNNGKKYSVRKVSSPDSEIQLHFSGNNEINLLEKLEMATFVLEKYNNFNSVCFFGPEQEFELVRLKPVGPQTIRINLYIPEYRNYYLDNGGKVENLYMLERLTDYWVATKYPTLRFIKIVYFKVRVEIQRLIG